jgi:hypothetical protein
MFAYKLRKHIQLMPAESPGSLKGDWLQPELRDHVPPPDVNVRRLRPIQGNKEKPIRTRSENSRHAIANSPTHPRLAQSSGRPSRLRPRDRNPQSYAAGASHTLRSVFIFGAADPRPASRPGRTQTSRRWLRGTLAGCVRSASVVFRCEASCLVWACNS